MLRGHRVALITDDRGARIPGLFDKVPVHILPAGRLSGGPIGWLQGGCAILTGRAMALALYREFPPARGDRLRRLSRLPGSARRARDRIPTAIHEQNAVLGRVNRLMAVEGRRDRHLLSQCRAAPARELGRVRRQSGPRRGRRAARPAVPAARRGRRLPAAGDRRQPGRRSFPRSCPTRWAASRAFPAAAPGHPAVPAEDIEQVRARYAAHRHPRRSRHLSPRSARPARLVASGHRPRRRLDHRRADRGRPAGDPGAAAVGDRRPSDRQCARDGQGRRRADDRAGQVHAGRLAKQMQKLALDPEALANAAARASSASRRGAGARRPGRADRPPSRRRSRSSSATTLLQPMPGGVPA